MEDGFDFLGYRLEAGRRRPRDKSLKKFKDTVRAKTKRTAGHSLSRIIEDLNRTLRGWFEYFKHSHRSTYAPLDGWIRRRLRNILRKQHGRSGISRGYDNIKWPMPSLPNMGFSACVRPMLRYAVLLQVTPSTGEPDAGDPHVRFGGRGDRTQSVLPTPITAPAVRAAPEVAGLRNDANTRKNLSKRRQ
jgi:hypothetical protein